MPGTGWDSLARRTVLKVPAARCWRTLRRRQLIAQMNLLLVVKLESSAARLRAWRDEAKAKLQALGSEVWAASAKTTALLAGEKQAQNSPKPKVRGG